VKENNHNIAGFYDHSLSHAEQLPRSFSVTFREIEGCKNGEVRVIINDEWQVGDIINDNSHENDFYRYHDVFHYTFATMLGWSPCARSMMKRKRKSMPEIDRIEDGARATITEEAISLLIFNEARRKHFFAGNAKISKATLRVIKEITETFEVKNKSIEEWENAISIAYKMFRQLIKNKGGKICFDMIDKSVKYSEPN